MGLADLCGVWTVRFRHEALPSWNVGVARSWQGLRGPEAIRGGGAALASEWCCLETCTRGSVFSLEEQIEQRPSESFVGPCGP